jgi:hypothetical protein
MTLNAVIFYGNLMKITVYLCTLTFVICCQRMFYSVIGLYSTDSGYIRRTSQRNVEAQGQLMNGMRNMRLEEYSGISGTQKQQDNLNLHPWQPKKVRGKLKAHSMICNKRYNKEPVNNTQLYCAYSSDM